MQDSPIEDQGYWISDQGSGMRIVAGEFKSRQLKAPTWEGLRPTSDRLRETLFNVLGPSVRGARVLDGYAGTGAIGIEALSRGAAHVTFVERDPRAVRLIEENLARVLSGTPDARERYAIIRAGFADAARRAGGGFEIVVLDPPYSDDAVGDALDAAARLTGPATRLVIEHAKRYTPPAERAGLRLLRTVVSGDSALSFFGAADER
jgi:16S rRNA (guanine966-N2)-methyltransferase